MVLSVKSHLIVLNIVYLAERCDWEIWCVKIRVDVAVELTMTWCFSSPSPTLVVATTTDCLLHIPPFFLFSFLVRSSSWSLCSTRSTSATFSQRTGPLRPNFPSNSARFVPPDLAPRVAIPPDPLTDPFLPHLTSRRLRSPLFSLQRCCFADARGNQRRCRHHPSSNSFSIGQSMPRCARLCRRWRWRKRS